MRIIAAGSADEVYEAALKDRVRVLQAQRDTAVRLLRRFNAAMELVRDERSETGGIDQLVDLTADTSVFLENL